MGKWETLSDNVFGFHVLEALLYANLWAANVTYISLSTSQNPYVD
jgi:hypothetical protein